MSQTVFGQNVERQIRSAAELREFAKMPGPRVQQKVIDHVDPLARRFIAASPLVIVASRQGDGSLDLTPRGDPPGFVKVLGDNLLALPDRPGNNRMDTFNNVIETGVIGLIFLIPGHGDTLRVSGKAAVVRDAELGQSLAVNGRPSEFAILVEVERVLSHCPKAFVRGHVWTADAWPDTSDVPTLAEMVVAHAGLAESVAEMQSLIDNDAATNLY